MDCYNHTQIVRESDFFLEFGTGSSRLYEFNFIVMAVAVKLLFRPP